MTRKFNFELAILSMNAMYKLPIAPYPQVQAEADWQLKKFYPDAVSMPTYSLVIKRIEDFFGAEYKLDSILRDEIKESQELVNGLVDKPMSEEATVDFLVGLADLLADIQVYCASEMARFGLPNQEILRIVMESNESKLGADGKPIYNEQGKFMKGPNYWPPEPKIRELILQLRKDAGV